MIDQEEIHNQFFSDNPNVRYRALWQLKDNFSLLPNREQAWNYLRALTWDEDSGIMSFAAHILGCLFTQLPDKQDAWNDLHRLTNCEIWVVRYSASYALVPVFPHVPDKEQAWSDLHRLAKDEERKVRLSVADVFSSVFPYVPDKQEAWNDLIRLTNDMETNVRSYANHSLGKISIFKASQAETDEDYKRELENAIEFFENATKEAEYLNPSQFCLPFYRSFYTIISAEKIQAKEEVDKYLAEVKEALNGSNSKKLLFEAVENLANALYEAQNLGNTDFQTMKEELSSYRVYCDHAEELMKKTEIEAPFAVEAIRKGLPILDRNLKELIEEIQNKAKKACQESQGTLTQEIACTVNREVQKWEIGSQEEMSWYVSNLVRVLKSKIPHTLENKEILDRIESMKYEKDLTRQYAILPIIIGLIPTVNVIPADPVIEKMENSQREILEAIRKIGGRLDYISAGMNPGISEELILHLGYITSAGGVEYTLTIPLQGLSYPEIKEELKEIADNRISQLSTLPKKTAKIVEDYLVRNKMDDLLKKLR